MMLRRATPSNLQSIQFSAFQETGPKGTITTVKYFHTKRPDVPHTRMSSLFSIEAELRGAGCFHYISDIFNFNFIERDIENACLHIIPRDKARQKQYASILPPYL